MEPRIVTVDDVDQDALYGVLRAAYGRRTSEALRQHGEWIYRGNENRMVLLVGDAIAGYCGVIPTTIAIRDRTVSALWWVDLWIQPEFRRRGLERLLDAEVRRRAELVVGFSNEVAAKIHRKHNWGVRDDVEMRAALLRPRQLRPIREKRGVRGFYLRTAAGAISPFVAAWRYWLSRSRVQTARRLAEPTAELLAGVFERHRVPGLMTTVRDVTFCQWRFLDVPYRDDLDFYVAGPVDEPTL